MFISFIIPIYNGEKYLHKCIDSLLQANFPKDNFEIICIDDCSTDNSRAILSEYKSKYSNISIFLQSQNSKTSTACNIGIANAQGDYIWVIGQDDWIDENSYQIIEPIISQDKPEVIAFNYRRVDTNENELHSAEVFDNSEIVSGKAYIRTKFGESFPHYLLGYEWRAIFKREFLLEKGISFPNGAIYEDTTFLFKAILYAEKFRSISDYLYYYRVNDNSITDFNKKYKGILVFEFAFKSGNEVLDLAEDIKDSHADFSIILFNMAKWYFNGFAHKIIATSFNEKLKFYRELGNNKEMVVTTRRYLNVIPYILTYKQLGIVSSSILKPIYILKKKIAKRNKPTQEWCY